MRCDRIPRCLPNPPGPDRWNSLCDTGIKTQGTCAYQDLYPLGVWPVKQKVRPLDELADQTPTPTPDRCSRLCDRWHHYLSGSIRQVDQTVRATPKSCICLPLPRVGAWLTCGVGPSSRLTTPHPCLLEETIETPCEGLTLTDPPQRTDARRNETVTWVVCLESFFQEFTCRGESSTGVSPGV